MFPFTWRSGVNTQNIGTTDKMVLCFHDVTFSRTIGPWEAGCQISEIRVAVNSGQIWNPNIGGEKSVYLSADEHRQPGNGAPLEAYLVTWSQGEPTLVLAENFGKALDTFVYKTTDKDCNEEQVRSWIQGITKIADECLDHKGKVLTND